jgi:erythronate-4-phosphate dehydrogenase
VPAREITAARCHEADLLCVRSVTRVDSDLLAGSRVRFVGTATIGVDHVDTEWLSRADIAFASAPGSNANSVSEWFVAALLALATAEGVSLAGRTLGIVGVGNVGSRVEAKARALGLEILRNDPPRARREGAEGFVDLADLLAASDIVTLHVPLTRTGVDRTADLADAEVFARMKAGAWFLNSSRGGVVVEDALREALGRGAPGRALLDVFRDEPRVAPETLAASALVTPHVAGYSFDGKVAGTAMIYEAACAATGRTPTWQPHESLPPPDVPEVRIDPGGRSPEAALDELVRALYDIRADDARLRGIADLPDDARGEAFSRLRKEYPRRREFPHTAARLSGGDPALARRVTDLGFRVERTS